MTTNPPPRQNSVSHPPDKEIPTRRAPLSSDHGASSRANLLGGGNFTTWVHRAGVMLFVTFSAVFGVLLIILPWTPKWTDNYILVSYPALRDFLEDGFVRGMCSGLGAIDVWIGFSEATHYQEKES